MGRIWFPDFYLWSLSGAFHMENGVVGGGCGHDFFFSHGEQEEVGRMWGSSPSPLHIFPAHMRSAGSQAENRERLLAASWAPMVTAFEISSRALPFEAWATVPGLFKEATQP